MAIKIGILDTAILAAVLNVQSSKTMMLSLLVYSQDVRQLLRL